MSLNSPLFNVKYQLIGFFCLACMVGPGPIHGDKIEDQKNGIVFCETKREVVKGPYRSPEELKREYIQQMKERKWKERAREDTRKLNISNELEKVYIEGGKIALFEKLYSKYNISRGGEEAWTVAEGILAAHNEATAPGRSSYWDEYNLSYVYRYTGD